MQRIREIAKQVADTDASVLISGESGVGKEVVARYIHTLSKRRDRPFLRVNCAALPNDLLESELFGYERGAFTGAMSEKPGKFELAGKGSILLDEIGEKRCIPGGSLLPVKCDTPYGPPLERKKRRHSPALQSLHGKIRGAVQKLRREAAERADGGNSQIRLARQRERAREHDKEISYPAGSQPGLIGIESALGAGEGDSFGGVFAERSRRLCGGTGRARGSVAGPSGSELEP